MTESIDIHPKDLETVQAILATHVPELEVRTFGSRVQGTARNTSDLDLAIMTDTPITILSMADWREAFSESDLPFNVDIIDWATTHTNFRQLIEKNYTVIQDTPTTKRKP